MNDQERDMLLARLDERTENTQKIVEKIVEHQEDQNGYLGAAIADIRGHSTAISLIKWIGSTTITLVFAAIGFILNHILRN